MASRAAIASIASIAANMTAFDVASQLIADGVGTRRKAAPMTLIHSHVATEDPTKNPLARRALG